MKNFVSIGTGLVLGVVIGKLLKRKFEREFGISIAKYIMEHDDVRKKLIESLIAVDKSIEKSKKRRLFL